MDLPLTIEPRRVVFSITGEQLRTILSLTQLLVILFGALFWLANERQQNAVSDVYLEEQVKYLSDDVKELRKEVRDLRSFILNKSMTRNPPKQPSGPLSFDPSYSLFNRGKRNDIVAMD